MTGSSKYINIAEATITTPNVRRSIALKLEAVCKTENAQKMVGEVSGEGRSIMAKTLRR